MGIPTRHVDIVDGYNLAGSGTILWVVSWEFDWHFGRAIWFWSSCPSQPLFLPGSGERVGYVRGLNHGVQLRLTNVVWRMVSWRAWLDSSSSRQMASSRYLGYFVWLKPKKVKTSISNGCQFHNQIIQSTWRSWASCNVFRPFTFNGCVV